MLSFHVVKVWLIRCHFYFCHNCNYNHYCCKLYKYIARLWYFLCTFGHVFGRCFRCSRPDRLYVCFEISCSRVDDACSAPTLFFRICSFQVVPSSCQSWCQLFNSKYMIFLHTCESSFHHTFFLTCVYLSRCVTLFQRSMTFCWQTVCLCRHMMCSKHLGIKVWIQQQCIHLWLWNHPQLSGSMPFVSKWSVYVKLHPPKHIADHFASPFTPQLYDNEV